MNQIAEFVRTQNQKPDASATDAPVDPLNDTDSWTREKIEGWRTSSRNAVELGRGLLTLVVLINAAAIILFLALSGGESVDPGRAVILGQAVEYSLLGVIAGIVATIAGCLMHRSMLEASTLDLMETWRNLNTKEDELRKRSHSSASTLFWVTANFVVLALGLFVQGTWIAKDALV